MFQAGEKLCHDAGIYNLPPDVIATLGKFKYRFSFGQNLIQHSLELVKVGEELARQIGANVSVVKLGCLLHDIGKPQVKAIGGKNTEVTFYNHEVVGARIAKTIARRLKLSKKDTDLLWLLVRWHMFQYEPKMTDKAIRRFIRRVGKENIHDMMALRIGDRVGGGSKATSWRLTELQKRIGEQFYEPLSLKDLAIDGADVMQTLNIKPSRKVGEILNTLFEEILDDPKKNVKDELIKRLKELD